MKSFKERRFSQLQQKKKQKKNHNEMQNYLGVGEQVYSKFRKERKPYNRAVTYFRSQSRIKKIPKLHQAKTPSPIVQRDSNLAV